VSLWYESLAMGIYDCGGNKQARARCILSHFSMPVPRSWWEHALKTGQVDETHASVLRECLAALVNAVDFDLNYGLLVALAFVEEPLNEPGSNTANGKITVEGYLVKAKRVLAERPDLARLERLIDGRAQLP